MEQQLQTAVLAANRPEQPSARTWLQFLGYSIRRQPLGAAGGVIVVCLILAAVCAGQLAPYHPKEAILPPYHAPTRNFLWARIILDAISSVASSGVPASPSMSGWCR